MEGMECEQVVTQQQSSTHRGEREVGSAGLTETEPVWRHSVSVAECTHHPNDDTECMYSKQRDPR